MGPCFAEGDSVLAGLIARRVAADLTTLTEQVHEAREFDVEL